MANLLKRPDGFTSAQWDKMDRVSKKAAVAKAMGISFGQLDAMIPVQKIVKPEIPEGYKTCKGCGMPFFAKPKNKAFCNEDCRARTYYRRKPDQAERKRLYQIEYVAKKRVEKDG